MCAYFRLRYCCSQASQCLYPLFAFATANNNQLSMSPREQPLFQMPFNEIAFIRAQQRSHLTNFNLKSHTMRSSIGPGIHLIPVLWFSFLHHCLRLISYMLLSTSTFNLICLEAIMLVYLLFFDSNRQQTNEMAKTNHNYTPYFIIRVWEEICQPHIIFFCQ